MRILSIKYVIVFSDPLSSLSNHAVTRMDIEWSLVTRKRRFNPVLVSNFVLAAHALVYILHKIPYLFGRYSILVTLFML